MNRFLIIDTEQQGRIIGCEFNSEFEIDGRILSEEETMKKFREILKEGYNSWNYNHIDQHWEEFKKEL